MGHCATRNTGIGLPCNRAMPALLRDRVAPFPKDVVWRMAPLAEHRRKAQTTRGLFYVGALDLSGITKNNTASAGLHSRRGTESTAPGSPLRIGRDTWNQEMVSRE